MKQNLKKKVCMMQVSSFNKENSLLDDSRSGVRKLQGFFQPLSFSYGLKKAFDTIDHKMLLKKLQNYDVIVFKTKLFSYWFEPRVIN